MNFNINRKTEDKFRRIILNLTPKNKTITIAKGPCKGLKWVRGTSNRAECIGTHEKQFQQILKEHIKPEMTALDIGANAGFFTILLAKNVGPKGKVHSFEPLPKNIVNLKKNIEVNKFENVDIHAYALSNSCSTTTFSGSGYIGSIGKESKFHIATQTLDNLNLMPDIVKMDVEGAEDLVLEGAKRIIEKNKQSGSLKHTQKK